jgi:hypothetical protein
VHVVFCPQCNVELDHDVEDVGYLVECPACLKQFVAATDRTGDPLERPTPVVELVSESSDAGSNSPLLSPDSPSRVESETRLEESSDDGRNTPPLAPKPETFDTIQVECRVCLGTVTIAKADVGHKVECPLCQAVFLATARTWKKPSRRSRRDEDDEYDDDDERNLSVRELRKLRQEEQDEFNPKRMLRNAKADLGSTAGAIHVLGWIDLICGILSVILGIILLIVMLNNTTPGPGGAMASAWTYMNLFPGIGGVLLGALKITGGSAMKTMKNRNLAVLSCWASLLPLNLGTCISFLMFPTYFVSLVFGIMGLIALNKPSVKKAFEFNKPDGDMDVY